MRNFNLESPRRPITQEVLRELFEYRDGLMIWRPRDDVPKSWNKKYVGLPAGGNAESGNYRTAKIDGLGFKVHRLVWIYHHGEIPDGMYVDHVNQDRTDDRIENLRLATHAQNVRNVNRKANKHGLTGVNRSGKVRRYQARIAINKKRINLGMFDSADEAHQAYVKASLEMHGEFSPFYSGGLSHA